MMKHRELFRTALLFVGLLLLPFAAHPQGTLADYERAQSLRTKFQGLAINLPERANWIENTSRFWYRKSVKGGSEFVLVNAETLSKNPAFDQSKLAVSLSAAAGKHIVCEKPCATSIAELNEMLEACRRRYGDTFTLRFPGFDPLVLVSDPAAIKDVFTGDPDELRAGEANVVLAPFVGSDSLLLADGARHRRKRRLLMPVCIHNGSVLRVKDRICDLEGSPPLALSTRFLTPREPVELLARPTFVLSVR